MVELQVEQFLLEKLEEPAYADHFLLEVKFNPANKKVEVFVDSDQGLSLDTASQLNRYLQGRIDEAELLGEKYILDVSSPGLSRPLQLPRQYRKNIGRKLAVTFKEEGAKKSRTEKGILTEVEGEAHIVLQFDKKRKQGKKRITETIALTIPFGDIEKAVVKPSF